MRRLIRKADGFEGQEFFLVPDAVIDGFSPYPLLASLYLTAAGYFPRARHHFRGRPEGCKDCILIYCIEGRGWYEIEGIRYSLEKDYLLIIPAGTPHVYGADDDDPWCIHWAHFNGESAAEYLYRLSDNSYTAPVARNIKSGIITLFTDIYATLHQGYSINNLIYSSKEFEHILGMFFFRNEALSTGPGVMQYRAIEQSIHYMRNRLNETLNLKEIAGQASLSVPHFCRIFKRQTGYPPLDFFSRLKVQYACQYLSTTDKPVKVIAGYLGYEDCYYFSRVFRKIMGMPPTAYRRAKKG